MPLAARASIVIELGAIERPRLGGALDFDESAGVGHGHVHIHLGTAILFVRQVEHPAPSTMPTLTAAMWLRRGHLSGRA